MASIIKRGPYPYLVRIRRKGWPVQSKTFETKEATEAWAAEVESEIHKGTFVSRKEAESTTLAGNGWISADMANSEHFSAANLQAAAKHRFAHQTAAGAKGFGNAGEAVRPGVGSV